MDGPDTQRTIQPYRTGELGRLAISQAMTTTLIDNMFRKPLHPVVGHCLPHLPTIYRVGRFTALYGHMLVYKEDHIHSTILAAKGRFVDAGYTHVPGCVLEEKPVSAFSQQSCRPERAEEPRGECVAEVIWSLFELCGCRARKYAQPRAPVTTLLWHNITNTGDNALAWRSAAVLMLARSSDGRLRLVFVHRMGRGKQTSTCTQPAAVRFRAFATRPISH